MYYGSIYQSLLCIFQQEFHLANLHYLRELTAQYYFCKLLRKKLAAIYQLFCSL